jgi:O-acetylserine/cysteine efflux transporter
LNICIVSAYLRAYVYGGCEEGRLSAREIGVLVAMCLIWGYHFVVIKTAVAELPPMFYAAIRMTLVALLMAPFLRWRPGQMRAVLAAGVCLGALNYAFLFTGLKYATASAAAIAIELHVPFATILSVIFLKDSVGWRRIVGIALAFAGVAVIALGENGGGGPETNIPLGVALVASGAFVEAIGAVLVKKSTGFKPFELLAWFAAVGSVGLWALTFTFETGQGADFAASDKWLITGAILYSAIGGSIIGHSAYYWLLQRLPVSVVAPSVLLTMVIAVFFGVVLLGDPFGPRMIIGGLMVLAGVAVVLLRNARKQDIKASTHEPGTIA